MAKQLLPVKFSGLNLTQHPKEVLDSELTDCKNVFLSRLAEWRTRPGLRPLKSEAINNVDELGDFIFRPDTKFKYRQIFTTSREYIDVFAIGNKVYFYDEDSNRFVLIYHAPGSEEVDIDNYLGHILITSHGSNLVVVRRYGHNAFLLNLNNHIIRAEGVIDPSTGIVDFIENDKYEDLSGDLKAFDIDETALYSASLATIGARTQTIDPAITGGTAVSNVVTNIEHNYPGELTIQLGYDHEDSIRFLNTAPDGFTDFTVKDDDKYANAFPLIAAGDESKSRISVENVSDFRDGLTAYKGGEDGVRYLKVETNYKQISKLKRSGNAGVNHGFTVKNDGTVYRGGIRFEKTFGVISGYDDEEIPTGTNTVWQYGVPRDNRVREFPESKKYLRNADDFSKESWNINHGDTDYKTHWAGKDLYLGHGRVFTFSLVGSPAERSVGQWFKLEEKFDNYVYGVWAYYYTGRTARDYIEQHPRVVGEKEFSDAAGGTGTKGQEIFLNNTSLNNLYEFVGVLILRSGDLNIARGMWTQAGQVWNPYTANKYLEYSTLSSPRYKLINPLSGFPAIDLGQDYSGYNVYMNYFIDKTTYHEADDNATTKSINAEAWEEKRIGHVSADGESVSYFDETTNTWLRDHAGYETENFGSDGNVKKQWSLKISFNDGTTTSESVNATLENYNPQNDNNVFDLSTVLYDNGITLAPGTTNVQAKITIPDAYENNIGYNTWIDKAMSYPISPLNRLEYEIFKILEFKADGTIPRDSYTIDTSGTTCVEIKATNILELSVFNLWYRIKSPFTENDAKRYFNTTPPPYKITHDSTNPINLVDLPMIGGFDNSLNPVMRSLFTFAVDWANVADIEPVLDEDEEDLAKTQTEDYIIQFAADDLKRIRLKYHSKDNLALNDIIDDIYLDTITEVWFAKARYLWVIYRDKISDERNGWIIAAFENDYRGMLIKSSKLMEDSDYGATIYAMKSFTFVDGNQYVAVLTDLALMFFHFRKDTGKIEIAEILDASTVVSKPIVIGSFIDVTFRLSDTFLEVYLLSNDNTNPITRVDIKWTADTIDPIELVVNTSGEVVVNRDLSNNELEYYFTYATNPFSRLGFIFDDNGDKKMIIADNNASMRLVNAFKFQVNSSVDAPTNYERILTDNNFGHFKEVKPINTPEQPVVSAISDVGTLSGQYLYFFVVREFDSDGEAVYESYPSIYSNYLNVSGANNTVQIEQLTNPYTQRTTDPAEVRLYVYRAKVDGYKKFVRLTDFYEVKSDLPMAEIGTTDTWNIVTVPILDTEGDAVNNFDKYRGYSNWYPRCKFVEVFNNVVYTANDFRYGNNIYFSELFDPTDWDPQAVIEAGAFSNDRITGLLGDDGLYVFTRDSAEVINGVGVNLTKTNLTSEVGCVDGRTLQLTNGVIIGLTEKGIYFFKGYQHNPLDLKVSRITQEFTARDGLVAFTDNYNQEYRIIYDNNKTLNLNLMLNQWSKFEYPGYTKILGGFNRENKETDLSENCFIVYNREKDAEGNDVEVYRIMVEDKYIPFDAMSKGGELKKIECSLTTKFFDMQNPYNEDIYRRVYLDLVNSHYVTVSISVNEGLFQECIKQDKRVGYTPSRTWFNDVPLVWFRFNELYGQRLINYGYQGGYAIAQRVQQNVDGKIDRTYRALPTLLSDIILQTFPSLNNATIMFWMNPEDNTREVVLSNSGYYYDDTFVMEPHTTTDFEPWISDMNETATEITMHKFIEDTSGKLRITVGGVPSPCFWSNSDTLGTLDASFMGEQTGYNTTGGEIAFVVATGETWNDFSALTPNGFYEIDIPRVGVDQMHVGQNNAVL